MSEFPELDELVKNCDDDTKLAVTAWVFKHIVDQANDGGSFRYLIYNRLGFGPNSYVPLYLAGGMEITNNFDMDWINNVKETVRTNKISVMKPAVNFCDEPDCFANASCGFPVEGPQQYRNTCFDHSKYKKED